MIWEDGYTEDGLYGYFGSDDNQPRAWTVAIFQRHVLLFGKVPPEELVSIAEDMKGKEVKEYPDGKEETMDAALASILPEYSDIDHDAVREANLNRLREEAAKIMEN